MFLQCRITLKQEYDAKYKDSVAAMEKDTKLLEELTNKNEELQEKLITKQRELRDAEKDAKQLQALMKQVGKTLQAAVMSYDASLIDSFAYDRFLWLH